MARRAESGVAFDCIRVEGALLQPEWLVSIARCAAGRQEDADYTVPRGMNVREEIGRYWRMARAKWEDVTAGPDRNAEPHEAAVRFVVGLLRACLGFESLTQVDPALHEERSFPIGHAALGGRVPVVIAPFGAGFDALAARYGDTGRKRTPFGLAQEFLNAAEGALWGVVSDGKRLRIVRDNASLTRPAWIEVDLARIFNEDRYAEFALFWLLAHESRFGRLNQPTTECPLEAWREAGRKAGTRAREQLRAGVERALVALGQGFVEHADNGALRAALTSGTLNADAYFQQLLRLVYRLIFLLTAEERQLLHPPSATSTARRLYERGYSIGQLRERAVRRNAYDSHADQWESVRIVFRALVAGEPVLGLPALGGLFAASQTPDLDRSRIANGKLLDAVFHLSWMRDAGGLTRVNWRDMGPEELGSVYEGLLELIPEASGETRTFAFSAESVGNARKKSGSYYTPDSLVQVLLDGALMPVIRRTVADNPKRPAEALLQLSIVDPACGSGHFLLAAARRLAEEIARIKAGGTPTDKERQAAIRQVVGRCLYGVDLNPMAVELCRVALWMEAVEPGRPLTFLDAHIRHGNALVGVTPGLMGDEVPDAAWASLEGDDRVAARALKARNEREAAGQTTMTSLWSRPVAELGSVARDVADLDEASDETADALAAKEAKWATILGSSAYQHQQFVADAWCAAFVWPKPQGNDIEGRPLATPLVAAAPTTGLWRDIRDNRGTPPALTVQTTRALAAQYHFFHWHLAFPTVFERGGFDVVLGNPPWERVKLQEIEFFAARDPQIAGAVNAAARKKLIQKLVLDNPPLWEEWTAALRESDGQTRFIRDSGRYPLCGKGDINTYALFAEHNRAMLATSGRAGFIVPTGIATDDGTKEYFGALVAGQELASFYSFENEDLELFPEVHHAFRFGLLCIARGGGEAEADLLFFARQARDVLDANRHFTLSPADFALLNPNTRTCPTFRSRRDADLNLALYRRAGVLWREDPSENPWAVAFLRMFDMTNDSGLFRTPTAAGGKPGLLDEGFHLEGNRWVRDCSVFLPLIEAKMLHHFDHRFGTYEGQTPAQAAQGKLPEFDELQHADPERLTLPYFWVDEVEVRESLRARWDRGWLLGWRDITGTANVRTLVASLFPLSAVGNTTPLMISAVPAEWIGCLYANLCAFALDYVARQKVGGSHVNYVHLKQFPILPPAAYAVSAPWHLGITVLTWFMPRVLELTYTAWDLQPFAGDVGDNGAPFAWSTERRRVIRAELDAAFFLLYGISRDDAAYILGTFPVAVDRDPELPARILAVYDELADAIRTGTPCATKLNPPPGDDRARHGYTAEVIALPTPLDPAWRDLPAGEWAAWAFPTERIRRVHAIAATLRALSKPVRSSDVLAIALAVESPWIFTPLLSDAERAAWVRVVGAEAVGGTSSTPNVAAWSDAVRECRNAQVFASVDGKWSAGNGLTPDLVEVTTFEARARVVVSRVADLDRTAWGDELVAFRTEVGNAIPA